MRLKEGTSWRGKEIDSVLALVHWRCPHIPRGLIWSSRERSELERQEHPCEESQEDTWGCDGLGTDVLKLVKSRFFGLALGGIYMGACVYRQRLFPLFNKLPGHLICSQVRSLPCPSPQDLAAALLPPTGIIKTWMILLLSFSKEGSFQSKASFQDIFKGHM